MHKYGPFESNVLAEKEGIFFYPQISHNSIYSTYMPNSTRQPMKPQISHQNIKYCSNIQAPFPNVSQQKDQEIGQHKSQAQNKKLSKNKVMLDKLNSSNKILLSHKSEQKPRQNIQVLKHQLDNDLQRLQVYIQNAEQAQSERRSTSWGKRKVNNNTNQQPKSQANIIQKNPQIQLQEAINYPYFRQNQTARNNMSQPIDFKQVNGLTDRQKLDKSQLQNKEDAIQHQNNQSSSSSFQSINYNTGKHADQVNQLNYCKKIELKKEIRDPISLQFKGIEKNIIESQSDKEEETKTVQLLQDPKNKVNDRYHHGDKPLSIVSANFFDSLKSNKQKKSMNQLLQDQKERPNSQLYQVDLQKTYQSQPHQKVYDQLDQVGNYASNRQFYDNANQLSSQRESYAFHNQTYDMFKMPCQQEPQVKIQSQNQNQKSGSKDEYYYQLNQLEDRLQDINSINQKILNENKRLQTKNKHLHKKVIDLKCRVKQTENLQKQQDQFVAQQYI